MNHYAIAGWPGLNRELVNRVPPNDVPIEQYADGKTAFADAQTTRAGNELGKLKPSGDYAATNSKEVYKFVRL